MKSIFIISGIMFLGILSNAQNEKVWVHLKNGSTIKGKVLESWSPETIKIKSNNNIWTFHENEVDTILSGRTKNERSNVEIPYHFKVEYGVLLGNSENTESGISFFQSSFNYGLSKKLFAGLGSGVEYYNEQSYIPLFANLEYKFRQTRFSPILFVKAGYLIPGEKQYPSSIYDQTDSRNLPPKYLKASGGIVLSPGFGFTSMLGNNFGFGLNFAYRYHALNFTGKGKYELEQRYNRLGLSLCIIFK